MMMMMKQVIGCLIFVSLYSSSLFCDSSIETAHVNPSDATITHKIDMEISIDGQIEGLLGIDLYGNETPNTSNNFSSLCKGDKIGPDGKPLAYKNSIFHRIIPNFMIQGGDFTHGNGTGGRSIYGEKFEDENFILKHTGKGILSMANAGPHTNGSQFFITTVTTPWLDGKHVVFGRVVKNFDVLQKMEAVGSQSGRPSKEVRITNCWVSMEPSAPAAVAAAA